jgi:hypothetical protein
LGKACTIGLETNWGDVSGSISVGIIASADAPDPRTLNKAVISVPASATALAKRTLLRIYDVQKAVGIRRTRERFVPQARSLDVHACRWPPVCVLAGALICAAEPLPRVSDEADGGALARCQSAICQVVDEAFAIADV